MNKSINGTYLNGTKISDSQSSLLAKDDKLHFGSMQSDTWCIMEIEAPTATLIPVTPSLSEIILIDMVALPSEESPQVTLYQSGEGAWMCLSENGTTRLVSGDLVGTQDMVWRFIDAAPTVITSTDESVAIIESSDVDVHFTVSQNEEHVSLTLFLNQINVDLGERTHHYLLLMLARQRLKDKQNGIIDTEQGWIDKDLFSKNLGLEESHINILIYRFRKQCIKSLPHSITMNQIIERRSGELRINCGVITIDGASLAITSEA